MKLTSKQKKELKQRYNKVIDEFKGHPQFPFKLLKMLEVHSGKSNDYASDDSPFANIELCRRGGVKAWRGVIIRLGDKYSRLLNALSGKLFKYEGIEDAFIDNANYSIIGLIEYEEEEGKNEKERDIRKEKNVGRIA